jgi:hypothetical protein
MQPIGRQSLRVDEEFASALRTTHQTAETDPLDTEVLADQLDRLFDYDITITRVLPTDNAARPRSILMVDVTSTIGGDESDELVEILCDDRTDVPAEAGVANDDGSTSYTVSDLQEADVTYTYDSLEIVVYDA